MNPIQKMTQRGMTLLEVTLAVAIFTVVIGITAQSLASYYIAMDVQEQRIEAAQSARTVLTALRNKRDETRNNFPGELLEWIQTQNIENWPGYVHSGGEARHLANHEIMVRALNLEGADAADTDNPIVVQVVSRWNDRRGRAIDVTLASALTDR